MTFYNLYTFVIFFYCAYQIYRTTKFLFIILLEPIPATTDSWAQGAVPKLHMNLSPLGEIPEPGDEPSELHSSDELPEKL